MIKPALKAVYSRIPFKPQLFTLVRETLHPGESIYKHLHFNGEFTVRIDGRPLRLVHYGYQIENGVFWRGLPHGFEPVSMDLWLRCCRQSSTILDVGANTGIYALAARTVAPEAEVFAFEPVERVQRKLELNCALNGFPIACERLALSNRTGTATIFDTGEDHIYSVTVGKNLQDADTTVTPVNIRTERLDDYWRRCGGGRKIDLMKVDVETHEREVLEGMGDLLRRDRPSMLIELLTQDVADGVDSLLAPLGYLYFNIDEKQAPQRTDRLTKSSFHNFFVCQEDRAREIGLI